jgi:hypothetical protein
VSDTADEIRAGLPPDLLAVLRDQSVIVPQDAHVWTLIAEWAKSPSGTASAMTIDDWREAWLTATKRITALLAERDRMAAVMEAAREVDELEDGTFYRLHTALARLEHVDESGYPSVEGIRAIVRDRSSSGPAS